jgi:phosphoribosylaminoimidazole-succinocarboxamide synthase
LISVLQETSFPGLSLHARGKVRDLYQVGDDLLFVATDRISAFDHVLATGIPNKGAVLTQLSLFWFDYLKDVVRNHIVTANVADYPKALQPFRSELKGRSMLVHRANMFAVECVVRGYLSGSAWKEYQTSGSVSGIILPKGLQESEKLPEPIFTPATKAEHGLHDENIPFSEMEKQLGPDISRQLRDLSLKIYNTAAEYAARKGIIIADTKFEFGLNGRGVVLADEVLTPDSSRFWPAASYKPGTGQLSFDKQFVRDYLESIRWNKQAPAPGLPDEVAQKTSEKYVEAFRLLSGKELEV